MKIPDKFRDAPELVFGLQLFYDAFWQLDPERPRGVDIIYPIPPSMVRKWCEWKGIDEIELIEDMLYHVRELDLVYMKYVRSKTKRPGDKDKPDGQPPRKPPPRVRPRPPAPGQRR